jgi:hypothetical protein
VCGYDPTGTPDDTLVAGRVTGESGEVIATLVNYACHPTTLAWDNRTISPDYIGATREVLERHTGGAPCLFLQGTSGELAPREQYTGDLEVADRNGRVLGYAAVAVLEGMLPAKSRLRYAGVVESGAPLATWSVQSDEPSGKLAAIVEQVELPLKGDFPEMAEIERRIAEIGNTDRVQSERLRRKRRVRINVGDGRTSRWPLWVWRIGDAYVVAQANEAYSHLSRRLREQFRDKTILTMNVTNGCCGYLPPADVYDQDLYQVWQTPFDRGSLERVTDAAMRAIDALV